MALWRLQILGEPTLTSLQPTAEQIGFQYHRTWLLLASLALSSRPIAREDLVARLWPDGDADKGRHQLRTILRDLIHGDRRRGMPGIGKENVQTSRDALALRPNTILTDYAEMHSLWDKARLLRKQGKLLECATCLHDAAVLFGGPFLNRNGLDDSGVGWLPEMRSAVATLEVEVWQQLHDVQVVLGDQGDARALWEAQLRLFGPQESPRQETRKPTWEELVPTSAPLAPQNLSLTVQEERLLVSALTKKLEAMPKAVRATFQNLSVFPQPFTVHQAQRITRADNATLALLTEDGLLRGVGERYQMPAPVRQVIWKRLSTVQRQRLSERHARHFYRFDGDGWPNLPIINNPPVYQQWRAEERGNYFQALDWCLKKPLDDEACVYIDQLVRVFQEEPVLQMEVLRRSLFRIEEFSKSGPPSHREYYPAIRTQLALREHDFASAVRFARLSLESAGGTPYTFHVFERLMSVTHHAGLDVEFDEAATLAQKALENAAQIDTRPLMKEAFERAVYSILADNHYTRENFDTALQYNYRAEELEGRLEAWPPVASARRYTQYQRASILKAMGQLDEALTLYDRIFRLFSAHEERHNAANCLRHIGIILRKKGLLGMARSHIEQALAIYTDLKEMGGRSAALGDLGDLLAQTGDHETALQLYTEGLDFWRSTNHPHWIARFEERISRLGSRE